MPRGAGACLGENSHVAPAHCEHNLLVDGGARVEHRLHDREVDVVALHFEVRERERELGLGVAAHVGALPRGNDRQSMVFFNEGHPAGSIAWAWAWAGE